MGKVAVVGCGALRVDDAAATATFTREGESRTLREGDWISLDGFKGEVLEGRIETRPSEVTEVLVTKTRKLESSKTARDFVKLLAWADSVRQLGVLANADLPEQAEMAVALGAEGIGLCRTEHMFFGPGKIEPVREMILATHADERRRALERLLPLQRDDFAALFRALGGRPCTIRTLDPPLNEFLPRDDRGIAELAGKVGLSEEELRKRVAALSESNPMMGMRGCRLGITHPEITGMQVRALFEAACAVEAGGVPVHPSIMIPLVGAPRELADQVAVVRATAAKVFAEKGREIAFKVGTMIEVPRAALVAEQIAKEAEFFSFGTNDLTQMTFGLSRDDVGPVLQTYLEKDIYPADPFVSLDRDGVGALMRMAVQGGRAGRPGLEIGLCGEHGGDPGSVEFCHQLKLNYVSCSPLRVPVARLAAARAALSPGGQSA
jgi:pyruvate,orthophosphate dikinase